MKLITVEASFAPENLASALDVFAQNKPKIEGCMGCCGFDVYASPNDQSSLAIIQRWDNMQAFDAYRGSELFMQMGGALKPLMSKPPVTTVCEVEN